jgi:hypothetical protein
VPWQLLNLDTSAGKLPHLLVHELCATVADFYQQAASRCVPVMRSVLRIELPSTKQLMTWTRRASGARFMGLLLSFCMQYD